MPSTSCRIFTNPPLQVLHVAPTVMESPTAATTVLVWSTLVESQDSDTYAPARIKKIFISIPHAGTMALLLSSKPEYLPPSAATVAALSRTHVLNGKRHVGLIVVFRNLTAEPRVCNSCGSEAG